jgi:predicted metal-binding membrane protein
VTSALLIVAAAAWLVIISLARDMGVMPGTMGLGLVGFIGVWSLMMGAMMLPSISPLSSLYARTVRDNRFVRLTLLTLGYLAVWAAAGFVAYVLAAGSERLAVHAPGWAQAVAVGSCFACGIYQMTSLKDRCLQHCRSPLGHLIHYTSLNGPVVDLRVGINHGAWCLGCCWSLMVLLVTFGVMNVLAMILLAAVIVIEKIVQPRRWFSILVGLAAIGLGIAIWIHPSLASGLFSTPDGSMGEM